MKMLIAAISALTLFTGTAAYAAIPKEARPKIIADIKADILAADKNAIVKVFDYPLSQQTVVVITHSGIQEKAVRKIIGAAMRKEASNIPWGCKAGQVTCLTCPGRTARGWTLIWNP